MTNTVCSPAGSRGPIRILIKYSQWKILPFPTQPGQVGGHEGVGKVVKLGPRADAAGLKVGDRVGVKWISSACGHCGKQAPHETYNIGLYEPLLTLAAKKPPVRTAPTAFASIKRFPDTTPQAHSNNTS